MYIETSSNNKGANVLVSLEGTDNIQTSNITFYYNRFSFLTSNLHKSMGRFRIQILLEDNTWSTQYTIPENSQFSNTSTDWTLFYLIFTVENYSIKLIFGKIDSSHAVVCFSNITKTDSV